ncbi:MAG: hypothetical protein JF565_08050 [Propionibacteriales bacterium]|nr:hypothetical protein [Propionibacteriales bacterium]
MTQYLMSVIHDWDKIGEGMTEEEIQQSFADTGRFNDALKESGSWVFVGGLTHPSNATVVDGRKDQPLVTDGPYAEVKEQLGGFWVIDVADLDEALDLAAKASAACRHPVEVRPFAGPDGV